MNETVLKCIKCKGEMEQGFSLDHGQGGVNIVQEWVQGKPTPSFWFGTKAEHPLQIVTFRCKSCGFLESYANDKAALR